MRPSLVLFGDSLTELAFGATTVGDESVGWASLLASSYSRRADVLNRGYRGYTTEMALQILPQVFTDDLCRSNVLFCTVFLGANDCVLQTDPRHVPLDKFAANLRSIITSIREKVRKDPQQSLPPIILLTPPPLDIERRKEFCLREYGDLARAQRSNKSAKAYGKMVKEIGKEMECCVVDTFTLLGGNGSAQDYRDNLIDGLHLTAKGNVLVYRGLMELLERDFPDLAPMNDGEGRQGKQGVPLDQKLWSEF